MSDPKHIAFLWDQCCDYHMDRVEILAEALPGSTRVTVIEIASLSRLYDWPECRPSQLVRRITLFPDRYVEDVGEFSTARKLLSLLRREQIGQLFLAGYEHQARFFLACWMAISGQPPVIMLDSKFDDKPRQLRLELLKRLLLLPYRAGLASGSRAEAYLRFLGFKHRPVALGYDTISVDRIRRLANKPAPAWRDRPFLVVARLIPKKNLKTALRAFAALPETRRQLRICGGGPLRDELEQEAQALGIADRVTMLGSVSQAVIAREMAGALCLVHPSREEQWGLVINEALAVGLPILVGDNVGACDSLVANYINGLILDCDDVRAWTFAMDTIDRDESLWTRFAKGSAERAHQADAGLFAAGVCKLIP